MKKKNEMNVAPAPGREVPDPERGGLLPIKGATVPRTPYWVRRVNDKDVVVQAASEAVDAPTKGAK